MTLRSRHLTLTSALALIAALGLAGCSASAGDYSGAPQQDGMYDSGGENLAADASDGTVGVTEQSFVTTGYLTVTAEDPAAAAAVAVRIVEGVGGRVDARQEYAPTDTDKGSSTLTLRIPSSALTTTLTKLKELGEPQETNTSSENVTGQVTDLDARIKAKRASVDRLTELLASATDTDKLVTIEASLSDRQEALERLEAQQRSLSDQVSLSTITLNLVSTATVPVDDPDTFLTGLAAGWTGFVAFISGLVVAFGVLLPWLVFFGIIGGIVYYIVRRRRRRTAKSGVPTA